MSEAVHGTAVTIGADGVLIRGEPGAGKSALALALIGRGARLIGDDRVMLSACHGRVVASAPSALQGMIELRGRGLLKLPHERSGVIRLIVDIVAYDALERMPEEHQFSIALLGITLPRQPVPPETERAVTLVEAAAKALPPTLERGLAEAASLGMMTVLPPPTAAS